MSCDILKQIVYGTKIRRYDEGKSVRRPSGFAIRRQKNDLTSLCSGDMLSPAIRQFAASFEISGIC